MQIFLLGFMGCGKSTLGQQLARKMNFSFLDLDQIIEQKMGQNITEIFAKYGEIYFRKVEKEVLHSCQSCQNTVLALGGGTPCFFDNMDWINQQGISVFLQVPIDILVKRLWKNRSHRPLISTFSNQQELTNFVQKKLSERLPYYTKAQLIFDNSQVLSKV